MKEMTPEQVLNICVKNGIDGLSEKEWDILYKSMEEYANLKSKDLADLVEKYYFMLEKSYDERRVLREKLDVSLSALTINKCTPLKLGVSGLIAENEKLRERHQWISVTEALPENIDGYRVLGLRIDGNMYVISTWVLHMQIKSSGEYYTHWMPLPDKPESEEEPTATQPDLIDRKDLMEEFERLKSKATSLRDMLYLDAVLAVIETRPKAN